MHPPDRKEVEDKIEALLRQRHLSGVVLLFDTYGAAIYGVIIRLVDDKIIAEKLLSDTLISIYIHIGDYKPEFSTFFTWVIKVARSTAKDYIFADGKSDKDHCHESVFDLVINQGVSIEAIAKLFSMTNTACKIELRKEIKIKTKQL